MTAMVTQRAGGLEAFRKSWTCGDCGGRSSVAERECGDCGQVRGSSAPRTSQSFALNNQGNGSVVNNVLVVGGNVDNGEEHYHLPEQHAAAPEPAYEYRMVPQVQPVYQMPRQLTGGEKALITGANVATWASVFVLVPAAMFFVFLLVAGLAQLGHAIPH